MGVALILPKIQGLRLQGWSLQDGRLESCAFEDVEFIVGCGLEDLGSH